MARASLQKKGKRWYIVFIDPESGKQRWESTGQSRKCDARLLLDEKNLELSSGSYRSIQKSTFADFVKIWLDDYIEPKREERSLKTSTYIRYKGVLNHYLLPTFGKYLLNDISPAMILKFKSRLTKEGKLKDGKPTGKKLTNSSIRTILIVLNAVFKGAIKLGYLKRNPAENIERPKIESKETQILTPQEIRNLLNTTEEPYKTLFMVAIMTGMRHGEILALRWSDVDFERKLIFVRRSVFRKEFSNPKSKKSIRVLAMDDRLASALFNHKLSAPANKYDLVFCTSEGDVIDGGHLTKVQYRKALERAGIDKKVRFHDLRHSFASLLILKGEHPKVIQSVMGHANIQTTMNIYGHLMPETHIESAAKVSAAIFGDE